VFVFFNFIPEAAFLLFVFVLSVCFVLFFCFSPSPFISFLPPSSPFPRMRNEQVVKFPYFRSVALMFASMMVGAFAMDLYLKVGSSVPF